MRKKNKLKINHSKLNKKNKIMLLGVVLLIALVAIFSPKLIDLTGKATAIQMDECPSGLFATGALETYEIVTGTEYGIEQTQRLLDFDCVPIGEPSLSWWKDIETITTIAGDYGCPDGKYAIGNYGFSGELKCAAPGNQDLHHRNCEVVSITGFPFSCPTGKYIVTRMGKPYTRYSCCEAGEIPEYEQPVYGDIITLTKDATDYHFHKWSYEAGSCIIFYPASSSTEAEPVINYDDITYIGTTPYHLWRIEGTTNSIISDCGAGGA